MECQIDPAAVTGFSVVHLPILMIDYSLHLNSYHSELKSTTKIQFVKQPKNFQKKTPGFQTKK
jgi:hypothetical protein